MSLGRHTAMTADHDWPKEYSIVYTVMLCKKNGGRRKTISFFLSFQGSSCSETDSALVCL